MSVENEHEPEVQSLEEELEEAKRYFALKEWPQAVNSYAEVLETMREKYNEEEAIFAPIFHRYGHSLLELAIATSGALGGSGGSKEAFLPEGKTVASAIASKPSTEKEAEKAVAQASSSSKASSSKAAEKLAHDPRFTFGGDAEDSEDEQEGAVAANGVDEDEDDDLGLAFSILELARVLYEKTLSSSDTKTLKTVEGEEWSQIMIKSQLAEVLNDLADVGLESENFQQASTDYKSSLDILTPLLQPHSRRLADAYLRLGLALEFHPDTALQSTAHKFVTGACTTLEKRLESLQARQRVLQKEIETGEIGLAKAEAAASDIRSQKAEIESEERLREEGILKGEAIETRLEKDDVASMDWEQIEKEMKDVTEMIQELKQKLEDYASNSAIGSANGSLTNTGGTVKEKVQAAINEVLLGSSTNALGAPPSNPNAPVNDLSAMVKKKKKPLAEEPNGADSGKRKEVSSEAVESESNKKVKTD